MDDFDKTVGYGLILFVAMLFLPFIVIEAFAEEESELREYAGGFFDTLFSWIYQTTDELMGNVEVPENQLNFTTEEANDIYDSGKKVTDAGVGFLREAHHMSGDLAEGALPFPVHPDLLFLLGLVVVGAILILRHKKVVKDIGYIMIGIIVLAVILFIVQLNFS